MRQTYDPPTTRTPIGNTDRVTVNGGALLRGMDALNPNCPTAWCSDGAHTTLEIDGYIEMDADLGKWTSEPPQIPARSTCRQQRTQTVHALRARGHC